MKRLILMAIPVITVLALGLGAAEASGPRHGHHGGHHGHHNGGHGETEVAEAPAPFSVIVLIKDACDNGDGTYTYLLKNTGTADIASLGIGYGMDGSSRETVRFDPKFPAGTVTEITTGFARMNVDVGGVVQDFAITDGPCETAPQTEPEPEQQAAPAPLPTLDRLPYQPLATPWWEQTPMAYE